MMSNMKIITDSPLLWQVGFQSPATPVMEGIFGLHNLIMVYVILVFTVVVWFLTRSLYLFHSTKNLTPLEFNHDPVIETIWTIAPAFILVSIAMPSFSLLYSMDDVIDPALTVKITGHQWYWSYELNVFRVDSLVDYFNIPLPKIKDWKLDPKLFKLNKFLVEQKRQEELNSGFYKYLKPFIKNPKPKVPKAMLYDFNEEVYRAKARVELSKAEVKAFDEALVNRYFPPMTAKVLAPFIDVDKMVREQLAYEKIYDRFGPNLSKTISHRPRVKSSFFALFDFITEETRLRNSIQWVSPPIKFDSYMLPEAELPFGGLRLLEVDNPLVLPINTHIKLLITSADVIHSWAVPSLGVKMDAIPGRLNQSFLFIKRTGVFYGQCSELCGVNHGFMPIVVKAVTYEDFTKWALHRSSALKLSDIVNSSDWNIKVE